jgi:transcriptional regulator with XRE-family HTH domain
VKFNPDALKEARLRAGLTKPSLAKIAGLSVDTVYRVEGGRTKSPSSDIVQRLAKATGVEWSSFFAPALPPTESEAV